MRFEYIKALSERLGIKEEIIKIEMAKIKQYGNNTKSEVVLIGSDINSEERNFISVLVGDIKYMDYIPEHLQFNFTSDETKKIFDVLRDLRKKGIESVKPSELIEMVGSDTVSKVLIGDFKPLDPEKFVKAFVEAVLRTSEKKRLEMVKHIDIREFMEISKRIKGSKRQEGREGR